MDKFFHSRFFRFLICLLLVLAFLVNSSPIRARAVAAETFMVTLEAFISACLIGLGLSPQVGNYSSFNQIVSDCKEYFQTATVDGLEIVSSGSQLMLALTYPGHGSYYVRKNFLDSIKNWLFASNTIVEPYPYSESGILISPIKGNGSIAYTSATPIYCYYFKGTNRYGNRWYYSLVISSSNLFFDGSDLGCNYSSSTISTNDSSSISDLPFFDVGKEDPSWVTNFCSNWSSSSLTYSYPDGISVSDVVPQVGEDIEITYIDWKELEKQLNEVGSDGEGDDSEDPTNPMIHIPYWPIWSPQFSDPDATLDDVLQSDVWTKGASSTWDPSHTGTSTGSDTSGSWVPSSDMGHFTLDLKEYFPFCIPFDLYDFFTCLNASPVAPVIEWVIPMPGGGTYPMEIDLSVFDSVAQLLRRLQLLLFCVGLAFKTRDLIKG